MKTVWKILLKNLGKMQNGRLQITTVSSWYTSWSHCLATTRSSTRSLHGRDQSSAPVLE
jgi:hypothetical protein